MKIVIIGRGAIARYVAGHVFGISGVGIAGFVVQGDPDDVVLPGVPVVNALDDLPLRPDLLVDCAGHAGLACHGPAALAAGTDVLSVSPGAMAGHDVERELLQAARQGRARLGFVTGAIGAIDALTAAREGGLSEVCYTGRKPPAGWKGSAAEAVFDLDSLDGPQAHFEGTAREAALRYPKNANVAAMVAMAGKGLDDTGTVLVADPSLERNRHEISASGAFGEMSFVVGGRALPGNPSSSALAAMSVVAAIRRRGAAVFPLAG